MNADRNYYLVPEGSETERLIEQFDAERTAVLDSWVAYAEKYGSGTFGHNNRRLIGLQLNEKPEGWIQDKQLYGCYRPHSRMKVSREARKAFDALPTLPGGNELAGLLGTDAPCIAGTGIAFRIIYPNYERIGDRLILSLHENHKVPADVEPLKHSEYWALKESRLTPNPNV